MKKLNLGCGRGIKEGWINIDRLNFGQEIVRDITKGLPLNDDSIDGIHSEHCLEHIEREDVPFIWEEIYRVLKSGGIAEITVPHVREKQAFMMAHLSYWEEPVVEVLCNKWGSEDHHTKTNFEILENRKDGEFLFIKLKKIELEKL